MQYVFYEVVQDREVQTRNYLSQVINRSGTALKRRISDITQRSSDNEDEEGDKDEGDAEHNRQGPAMVSAKKRRAKRNNR
jgi:hypothetical protein